MNVSRATKANGEPCTLPANGQHGLCWAHDPANREKRHRTVSRGGKAKANRELVEAKQQIKGVIAGVLSGRIDRNVGGVAFQGYRTLLSAISTELAVKEQLELVERLDALEGATPESRRAVEEMSAGGFTEDLEPREATEPLEDLSEP